LARLPSLSALRAFESAARHRSFTKAASELFLTQSAISRHIRSLEEWLGCPLFIRHHRSVALTEEGEIYMRELVAAFAQIELATRRIMAVKHQDILQIHAYATISMRWLIPRLSNFQASNPDIDVRLTASLQPIDFARDDVHCAIRIGTGDWAPDIRADKLFESTLIPVCSPRLLAVAQPMHDPNELRHTTLLHSLARPTDWQQWLEKVGADQVDANRGLKFESSIMSYLAAQQGMGVAIAQEFLVAEDLRQGTLICPYPEAVISDHTYFFLSSPRYAGSRVLETFRSWILEEAHATRERGPVIGHDIAPFAIQTPGT
jgi:LysR family glycine cleavage system transcriptional activator